MYMKQKENKEINLLAVGGGIIVVLALVIVLVFSGVLKPKAPAASNVSLPDSSADETVIEEVEENDVDPVKQQIIDSIGVADDFLVGSIKKIIIDGYQQLDGMKILRGQEGCVYCEKINENGDYLTISIIAEEKGGAGADTVLFEARVTNLDDPQKDISTTFPLADNTQYFFRQAGTKLILYEASEMKYSVADRNGNLPDDKYTDLITIYDLENYFFEIFNVARYVEMSSDGQHITYWVTDTEKTMGYASGYETFAYGEGVETFESEDSICQYINQSLSEYIGSEIQIFRTSWDDRWTQVQISDNLIGNLIIKLESYFGEEVTADNYVTHEFKIYVNRKDESREKAVIITTPDIPSAAITRPDDYVSDSSGMSSLPSYVNSEELVNLKDFDLDGYWCSEDGRYVYFFNTSICRDGPAFTAPIFYADTYDSGSIDMLNASIKQTSYYSFMINGTHVAQEDIEVYTQGNTLVAEDRILLKVSDEVVNSVAGYWNAQGVNYEFCDDGYFRFSGKKYGFGRYFITMDQKLCIGTSETGYRMRDYSVNKDKMKIKTFPEMTRGWN